jgi:metallophosphoesterase superfamily enzyme
VAEKRPAWARLHYANGDVVILPARNVTIRKTSAAGKAKDIKG